MSPKRVRLQARITERRADIHKIEQAAYWARRRGETSHAAALEATRAIERRVLLSLIEQANLLEERIDR